MKDILVVAKLKEGKFEKFMDFMRSEQGMNERRKIADLTKTLGTVSPDKNAVMFKICCTRRRCFEFIFGWFKSCIKTNF